ncbi:beta-glucanase precursor [Geofilum rubicundum JCM 15548]|uniref:Beta-glucanase n=1 Tax=Geofilum rubicundum JCM 15548 TaxID=1236989 RepID=A0A0E9LVB2_9BACT|nr:beta-glucanase precursor [Geofilum rubicundum JCM 15548]
MTFENTSDVEGIVVWNFGNGSRGKGESASAEYPFAGTYNISMTLYAEGGSATKQYSLVVEEDDLSLLEHPMYTALTGGAENVDGKTWVFDQYNPGHFGVGPVDDVAPVWWAAGPNDKLESSLYTQTFTFKQVGVELDWNNNGYVYTNGAGLDGLAAMGYTNSVVPPDGDFDVEFSPADSYNFSLNTTDSVLTLTDGAFMGHYTGSSTYEIITLTETEMYLKVRSSAEPGNGWWYRFVPEELNVAPVIPLKEVPLVEDFEGDDLSVVFATEAMGDFTAAGYQNPAPVPINPSSKVYLYQKKAGEFYSNISFVADGYKFDLSEQNQITLKVYMPSYNDYSTENNVAGSWIANKVLQSSIAVKLQNDDLGGNAWSTQTEILMTELEKDKWLELTFDFSGVADREDYNKILIQFGTEGHDGGGIFFFDDFTFHN